MHGCSCALVDLSFSVMCDPLFLHFFLLDTQKICTWCAHQRFPLDGNIIQHLQIPLEDIVKTTNNFYGGNIIRHLQIPLEDIVKATNNFYDGNIIRLGGFVTTYKGRLLRSERLMNIAAQRFDCRHGEGYLKFLTELSVLSDLKHTNLVSIIGFCHEKDEKIIVTTCEAYGSLKQYLNNINLTWTQRLRICVSVARALSYLHYNEGRGYLIIHRIISSATIFLDDKWEARLSCFENSVRQFHKDSVHLCEPLGATGYMDPAIVEDGGVTYKSDIYSLGVILFEMLCGGEAWEAYIKNKGDNLATLMRNHYENKTLHDIILPDLWNQMSLQTSLKYSEIAYSCLKEEPTDRPDMDYIAAKLEEVLKVAELEQKFRGGGKSWNPIYYLGKIIWGIILYILKIFRRKIGNFTPLTETLEGRVHSH
ncbi:putative protein kinase RLK-Pelle-CrRLK1L-1 family [Helianthus debilis subsp. tardiflorus]